MSASTDQVRNECGPGPYERYRLSVQVDPTAAELDVLRCAADGHSVPETALLLAKGDTTVKNQLMRARLKLGAKNTTHAVAIALRKGLIQ